MKFLKLNRFILIAIFILFLFIYAINGDSYQYSFVLFVPLCFIISIFLETKLYSKYTLILKIIYALSIFKFFIMPLMIVATDDIGSYGPKPTSQSFIYAIIITVLEIFTLLFAKFLFFNNKRKKLKINLYTKWFTKNISIKFVLLILLLVFFIVTNRELLMPKDIFSERTYDDDIISVKNSLAIVVKWIKLIGFPIISLFLHRFFNKKTAYYLSIIAFIFFGYLQLGTSRWTLIFYSIISFLFLYKLFGNKVKKVAIPISVVLTFVFLSISIYKFSWAVQGSSTPFKDVILVMSGQFQLYFSGPTLIAQSIDITNYPALSNKIGIETFINDYMGSVPLLSSTFEQSNRINYIFNEYIFGIRTSNQTQIIPMSGIGYIYCGLFGSTIFVFMFTYFALKLEAFAIQSKDIINYWLLMYMAIWCGCALIFSTQIVWGNLIANYTVLYIINNLINKMKIN